MKDLFEYYETLPQNVQDLISTITDEFDYKDCKQMVLSLNELGYTCEYGLDAQLFNLTKISVNTTINYDKDTLMDTESGILYDKVTKGVVGQHNT